MRLAKAFNRKAKRIQDFFYLYTSGLNHREIEQLLKKDAVDAYTYLKGKTSLTDHPAKRRTLKSLLFVVKEISQLSQQADTFSPQASLGRTYKWKTVLASIL